MNATSSLNSTENIRNEISDIESRLRDLVNSSRYSQANADATMSIIQRLNAVQLESLSVGVISFFFLLPLHFYILQKKFLNNNNNDNNNKDDNNNNGRKNKNKKKKKKKISLLSVSPVLSQPHTFHTKTNHHLAHILRFCKISTLITVFHCLPDWMPIV